MTSRLIAAALMVLAGAGVAQAKMMSEKERMRARAEHLCYNDVQTLCSAAIPDETRIAACMKVNRAQLSPGCRKVFEAGMK